MNKHSFSKIKPRTQITLKLIHNNKRTALSRETQNAIVPLPHKSVLHKKHKSKDISFTTDCSQQQTHVMSSNVNNVCLNGFRKANSNCRKLTTNKKELHVIDMKTTKKHDTHNNTLNSNNGLSLTDTAPSTSTGNNGNTHSKGKKSIKNCKHYLRSRINYNSSFNGSNISNCNVFVPYVCGYKHYHIKNKSEFKIMNLSMNGINNSNPNITSNTATNNNNTCKHVNNNNTKTTNPFTNTKYQNTSITKHKSPFVNNPLAILSQIESTCTSSINANINEYIPDIYTNLIIEERNLKYISTYGYMKNQPEINEQMRAILIDWLIDVHLKFRFSEETLYLTIYIIDIYLSIKQIQRVNLQLLGVTALFIACKEEEISFPQLNEYVYITDYAYTKENILAMEFEILKLLEFNLVFPSPLRFYEILSYKIGFDERKFYLGRFLLESFMSDYKSNKYFGSEIACTCVYIVMKVFKLEGYQLCFDKRMFNCKGEIGVNVNVKNDIRGNNNNYRFNVIKECAKDICYFVDVLNKGFLEATKKKYSTDMMYNVANLMWSNNEVHKNETVNLNKGNDEMCRKN